MPRPSTSRRTLVVEARDLDTDERAEHRLDVDAPSDDPGRRAQLATIVARLHPTARMRSFGGGAASFLDAQHLVVARYAEAAPESRTPQDEGAGSARRPSLAT